MALLTGGAALAALGEGGPVGKTQWDASKVVAQSIWAEVRWRAAVRGEASSAAPMEEVVVLGGAGSGASRGSRPLFMGARQREEGDLSAGVLGEGNAAGEGATARRPGAATASAACPSAERRRCVASARRY